MMMVDDKKEDVKKLSKSEELASQAYELGLSEGAFKSALVSLKRRFTDEEFDALFNLFWLSPQVAGLRGRLDVLEKRVK